MVRCKNYFGEHIGAATVAFFQSTKIIVALEHFNFTTHLLLAIPPLDLLPSSKLTLATEDMASVGRKGLREKGTTHVYREKVRLTESQVIDRSLGIFPRA